MDQIQGLDDFPEHFDGSYHLSPSEVASLQAKPLGQGGQAVIETVTHEKEGWRCVRKRWRVYGKSEVNKATERFLHEITILRRLRSEPHVVTLLATYTQNVEFALLHLPWADCDLDELLHKQPAQRRTLVSDCALKRGLGCLCAALHFIHMSQIRHDDIKPKNILLHRERMIFTDFGVSRDFSELTSSITDGYFRGTKNYAAPETATGRRRGCAADVFALGCVILEVTRVLQERCPTDGQSESDEEASENNFDYLKPYSKNLGPLHEWIKEKRDLSGEDEAEAFWLEACQLMLAQLPSERPRMSNVLFKLRERFGQRLDVLPTIFCEDCLERHVKLLTDDELRNTDFVWGRDAHQMPAESDAALIQPNSNQGSMTVWTSRLLLSPLRSIGVINRWYLTVYLDNGRSLRSYGTKPACVNYSFDFGESLVDRIVFKDGTFGNVVELYERWNWPPRPGPCFRSSPCDERFDEPRVIRSYKVTWE